MKVIHDLKNPILCIKQIVNGVQLEGNFHTNPNGSASILDSSPKDSMRKATYQDEYSANSIGERINLKP